MSITAYPTLRLKLTQPPALKLQFLPAVPGFNAATTSALLANKVNRTGDAMTGFLTLSDDPTAPLHAATKQYVDSHGGGGGGGAPTNAEYITSSANATLIAERVLTNTASVTWDFSTAGQAKANATAAGISDGDKGDITVSGGGTVWTIDNDTVTYAKMQNVSVTARFLGRFSAGAGDPEEGTGTQATALLDVFTSTLKGLAPLSGGGTANFLRADGAWAAPPGGGGGAPIGAEYITSTADATLTAERVLTDTATITWDRTTAGQIKANTAAGGGNVSNSGTPTVGQYGKWVTATTIQGVAPATVLSDIGAQPLDGDLTSLAAASATNAIYYRSAANTWATVTIDTSLSFTAGTLARAALTGDVTAPAGNNATTIANDAVTYAKLQNISAASLLLGRGAGAGAGDPQEITIGAGLSMVGAALQALGITTVSVTVWTASTTFTPQATTKFWIADALGGGGGGGGVTGAASQYYVGAGGGSGAFVRGIFTTTAPQPFVIGAGGTGGVGSAVGGNGGDTFFNNLSLTAKGGQGGQFSNNSQNGVGGAGGDAITSIGTLLKTAGAPGDGGFYNSQNVSIGTRSGMGGSGFYGGGGVAVPSGNGTNAGQYGSGGAGASLSAAGSANGGNGSPGVIVIMEFA